MPKGERRERERERERVNQFQFVCKNCPPSTPHYAFGLVKVEILLSGCVFSPLRSLLPSRHDRRENECENGSGQLGFSGHAYRSLLAFFFFFFASEERRELC